MSGPIRIIHRLIFKAPPTKLSPPFILAYDLETKEVGVIAMNALNRPNEVLKYGTIQIIDEKVVVNEGDFQWRLDGVDYLNPSAYESALINPATDGYYRTDMLVGYQDVYGYVYGTESMTEAPKPPLPAGAIELGIIPVFGSTIGVPVDSSLFLLKAGYAGNAMTLKEYTDTKQIKDNQIEISTSGNIQNDWHGQTVLFTANSTQTVPATLNNSLMFPFRVMAGVTVTWAITAPFDWEGDDPVPTPEKTVGHFMRIGSSNTIILDV